MLHPPPRQNVLHPLLHPGTFRGGGVTFSFLRPTERAFFEVHFEYKKPMSQPGVPETTERLMKLVNVQNPSRKLTKTPKHISPFLSFYNAIV